MHTANPVKHNRWRWPMALLIITLFAFALRWYYVSTAVVYEPLRGDARQYFSYAWNLVHHGTFSKSPPGAVSVLPDNYRDPGYPLFLAIWMKALGVGNAWYATVLLCQALLGALTVTAAVQLGKHWLSTRWAIGAGLLMAVWPHSIAIDGYLLTETLFGFLCTVGLLLWGNACQHKNHRLAAAAGLTFGAAALTNAILLPFGIILAVFLAWRMPALRKICLTLTIASLLLPASWSFRNTHIQNSAPGSSSRDRAVQNLVQGSWPSYHSAWRQSILGDAAAKASARTTLDAINKEYETLRTAPTQGAKEIAQRLDMHPLRYAAWYLLQKPYDLWNWDIQIGQGDIYPYPTLNSPFRTNVIWLALEIICRMFNPLLVLLALAGLLYAMVKQPYPNMPRKQPNQAALVAVACLLSFATLVYTALQSEPRYSIPFRSLEILLALTTAAKIIAWRRQRKTENAPSPAGQPGS